MENLIVPIVLRTSEYTSIAPNGSYIAVDQFENPRELAAYLKELDANDDKYLKYHGIMV
jgi:hypothetical protein